MSNVPCKGNAAEKLLEQARGFLRNGEFNRALTEAWEAFEIAEKQTDAEGIYTQVEVIEFMSDISYFKYYITRLRTLAHRICLRYPDFYKELTEQIDDVLAHSFKKGLDVLRSKITYSKNGHIDAVAAGVAMINLGRYYFYQGNREKSLYWQNRGLKLIEQHSENTDSDEIFYALYGLARTYKETGNYQSAIGFLYRMMDILYTETDLTKLVENWADSVINPKGHYFYNMYSCINDLAEVYEACGEYKNAIKEYKCLVDALENLEDNYKYRDLKTRLQTRLVYLYGKQGNYDESDRVIKRAMGEQSMNASLLAWNLRCLAENLAFQKKYEEAASVYNRVLDLYWQTSKKDDYTTAEVLESLIKIYTETGNEEGIQMTKARLEAIV